MCVCVCYRESLRVCDIVFCLIKLITLGLSHSYPQEGEDWEFPSNMSFEGQSCSKKIMILTLLSKVGFFSFLMSYRDNYSLLKNTNLHENLPYGLHQLCNITGDIPFSHLTPDPCQQICVLLVGVTAVTACGSAGTNHASINTSDLNKHFQFSQAE